MSINLRKEEQVYLRDLGFNETWLQRQIANEPTLLRLAPDEQAVFLSEHHKCALATIDQSGFPHLVAMNFVFRNGAFYMTSCDRAQKVVNIRRDPKVAIMVETGDADAELKAVMVRGECEIIEDPTVIREAFAWLGESWVSKGSIGGEGSASKRVILKIHPRKIVTWDYSKLGGPYRAHA